MAEETAEIVKAKNDNGVTAVMPNSIEDLKPKMKLTGTVTRLELYGAFIDIGVTSNAILHISKLAERVNRVSDVLSVGDEVTVWIESVEPERDQVTLTMIEPLAVEWSDLKEGQIYTGTVTRLEKYGAFIDIGAEKDGLVHISELSHDYVKHPSEAVKVDDEIQVQVIGFNKRKRRIDLSRKVLLESAAAVEKEDELAPLEDDEDVALPTAMEIALRRALSQSEDEQTLPEKTSAKVRTRSRRLRDQQEDILNRTLKLSQESSE